MRHLRGVALAVVVAAGLTGCGNPVDPRSGSRPNVLLISVDTLRADHLGAWGYDRPTSPHLDALAAEGVRFSHAFAQVSWTLPSHMSLMTSTHPISHGVEHADLSLSREVPTLGELLSGAGYSTHGFVSWIYLKGAYGFSRGFDSYRELIPPPENQGPGSRHSIKAGELVDRVLAWADDPPEAPFFLFVHFFDPHIDYQPPLAHARRFEPALESVEAGRHETLAPFIVGLNADEPVPLPDGLLEQVTALYDGEIHYTDAQLGRLLEGLEDRGLLDDTLIVFVSDHGEELYDHGSMEGHGWTLYDETIRVPLIVRFPDGRYAGEVIDRVVQTLDVAPLILDAVGLEAPASFAGQSPLPLLGSGRGEYRDTPVFAQLSRWQIRMALRTVTHKLIFTEAMEKNTWGRPVRGGYELYDLRIDPGEQHNRFNQADPLSRELTDRLWEMVRTLPRYEPERGPGLDAEELERLRSLGYVR